MALLVLSEMSQIRRISWTDYERQDEEKLIGVTGPRWTVSYTWTLARFRRTGLATRLVEAAASWSKTAVGELAWYLPFTAAGERFVRRLCPDGLLIGRD